MKREERRRAKRTKGEATTSVYEVNLRTVAGMEAAEDLFFLVPDLDEDEEIEVDDAV